METKSWYLSKTLWVNLLAGVATVAGVFGLDLGLDAATQAEIAVGFLAVANIVLRLVTRTAVSA